MENKKLTILSLIKEKEHAAWKQLEEFWGKYIEINQIIDTPENIENYLEHKVDILFLDDPKKFKLSYYDDFKKQNAMFAYVAVKKKPSPTDVDVFKMLADRIVYTEFSDEYFRWSTFASLRRYWSVYSKPTTIIYKNIIADFVENSFLINKRKVILTSKEIDLFRYLLKNRGKIIPKKQIFSAVWGFDESDTTRTVDQMIFKLKKKIGEEYFHVIRSEGIKFS